MSNNTINNNKRKVMIFDVGGTLINVYNIDLERGIKYLYDEVFDIKSDYITFLEFTNQINHCFFDSKVVNIEVPFKSYLNYLHFIYPYKEDIIESNIEKTFAEKVCMMNEMPGVKAFLEYLVEKDYELCVLSNSMFSTEEIKRELKLYDLDKYFTNIVSSSDYIFKKPAREIFLMYYQKLRLDGFMTKNITYVGNNLICDIKPTINMKLHALYLGRKNKQTKDYLEFTSYEELMKMIENNPDII